MFPPHPLVKFSIVGSLRDREAYLPTLPILEVGYRFQGLSTAYRFYTPILLRGGQASAPPYMQAEHTFGVPGSMHLADQVKIYRLFKLKGWQVWRGSVLGLTPPGFEFWILCLKGSVIDLTILGIFAFAGNYRTAGDARVSRCQQRMVITGGRGGGERIAGEVWGSQILTFKHWTSNTWLCRSGDYRTVIKPVIKWRKHIVPLGMKGCIWHLLKIPCLCFICMWICHAVYSH